MSKSFFPAELQEIINIHRDMFGGFTMMSDSPDGDSQNTSVVDDANDGKPTANDQFKSEDSKRRVLEDLAAERDKRQQLEAKVSELEPLKKLLDAIAPDAKDAENPTDAALRAINERLSDAEKKAAAAEHRALVAEHSEGLTDEDKGLISKISDPGLMAEVAKRMRDASATAPATRRIPRPDPSVGRDVDEKSTSVASGRDLYAEVHGTTN